MSTFRRRKSLLRTAQFESLENRELLTAVASQVSSEAAGEPELVRFRLETTDLAGNPISQLATGEVFRLQVFVQDRRGPSASGVFSPYLDVSYESSLARVHGAVEFGNEYVNARAADTSQPGLLNEVGAFGAFHGNDFSLSIGGASGAEFLLFSVPMLAEAPGELHFVGDPADVTPFHDLYFYDRPVIVPTSEVAYGQATLTVLPPAYTIIDDGSVGFATEGAWLPYTGIGVGNDVHYRAAGNGAAKATWTLPQYPGQYRVSTTWRAHPNRATDAPYRVYADDALLSEVRLNQELIPNDFVFAGASWEVLGIFTIADDPLSIVLSDDANEFVIADAVLIERIDAGLLGPSLQLTYQGQRLDAGAVMDFGSHVVGEQVIETLTVANVGGDVLTLGSLATTSLPAGFQLRTDFASLALAPGQSTTCTIQLLTTEPVSASGVVTVPSNGGPGEIRLRGSVRSVAVPQAALSTAQTLDDGSPGFSTQNQWTPYSGIGNGGDVRFSAAGTGSDVARWSFTVSPGTYRIAASWPAHPNRATNAPYTIVADGQTVAAISINQRVAPNDFSVSGVPWEQLGTVEVVGHTLTVELTDAANGFVIADAIRIERTSGEVMPPHNLRIIDDGEAGFQAFGTWRSYSGIGRLNDVSFCAAGNGTSIARWIFEVTPGRYRVATTWSPHPNRATDAPYRLRDDNGVLASVTVNQRIAPNDFAEAGSAWEDIGQVTVTGTTLIVELSNAANGYVIADAVRLEQLP